MHKSWIQHNVSVCVRNVPDDFQIPGNLPNIVCFHLKLWAMKKKTYRTGPSSCIWKQKNKNTCAELSSLYLPKPMSKCSCLISIDYWKCIFSMWVLGFRWKKKKKKNRKSYRFTNAITNFGYSIFRVIPLRSISYK